MEKFEKLDRSAMQKIVGGRDGEGFCEVDCYNPDDYYLGSYTVEASGCSSQSLLLTGCDFVTTGAATAECYC